MKNLILYGPNGIGKTQFLKNIEKAKKWNEIEFDKKNIYSYTFESIKDIYDKKTGQGFKYILSQKKNEIIKKAKNDFFDFIDKKKYDNYLETKNENFVKDGGKIKKYNDEMSLKYEYKKVENWIDVEATIVLNGISIKIDNAPSGVKKFITIFETIIEKINPNEKNLIIIDEFENHLHPYWINIISSIINKWMDDKNIFVLLSTHSPLVISNLKNQIEFLRTIVHKEKEPIIKKINEDNLFKEFDDITKAIFDKNKIKSYEELIGKAKLRMDFEYCNIFFAQFKKILLVEGITDKLFFQHKLNNNILIINQFGFHNFHFVFFLLKYASIENEKIYYIGDLDLNENKNGEKQKKLKKWLETEKIQCFFFKSNIEKNLYGIEAKLQSFEKFNELDKNIDIEIKTKNSELWKFLIDNKLIEENKSENE